MSRPPVSRGAGPRTRSAGAAPGLAWADRAPSSLRLAIVLLFACVVTPVLLFLHPVGDYFVETDFYGGYAPGVRALWSGGLDPARYGVVGPVYELVLGLLTLTRIDLFRLAQFLSLGSTVLTIALASRWIERNFGRGAGWIAALLMATNPTTVRYAYTASTDAVFTCLLTAAFVTLFPAGPAGPGVPGTRRILLAGVLSGVATLTRYTGIAFVPLGILYPLWPGAGNPWAGRRVRAALLFGLGVLLVFGPWWAFTSLRGAPPTLRFYHNLAYEVYGRARGVTWDDYQSSLEKEFPTFRSVLERDPGAVARRVAVNSYEHLGQVARELWLWPLAALAALGGGLWLLRRAPGAGTLLGYGGLVYAALIPVFYASRYHLPLVFVGAGLAGIALGGGRLLPARLTRGAAGGAASALAILIALGASGFAAQATRRDTESVAGQVPGDLPAMGAALRHDWKGPGRPRLIARKPHLSYYADADPVAFVPLESLEALATYAHEQHADYLFMSWPEALLRPPFAFLLVPEFAPVGLELVSAGPAGHSALYRIRPDFGSVMPAWYPDEWEWRAGEGMTRIASDNAEYWLSAAQGRHARRDYAGAREAYDSALRLHPNWGAAYFGLGSLDADLGDFPAARSNLEAALRAGETSPMLLRNLGVVYVRLGDLARAEDLLTRYVAATHDPEYGSYLAGLRVRRAAGDGPGASR